MAKAAASFTRDQVTTSLSKTVVSLINDKPFYGHMLVQCVKDITQKVPTMAVAVRHQLHLYINPDFFMSMTDPEKRNVLEHEMLHLVFRHPIRSDKHTDHERSNVAADIVCNQYLDGPLPGDPCKAEKFKLEKGQDLDWYYKNLPQQQKFVANIGNGRGSHDPWGQQGDGQGQNQGEGDQKGKGGSGDDQKGKGRASLSSETKENIIKDAIRQAVEACASRGIGHLPGDVQQEIQKALEKKKASLPWYQILRRFAAHATRSTITYTKKRMSKRYQTRPGVKIGKQLNLLVGIDTSGSISDAQLEMFAAEIWFIKRCGADVTVCECDAEIHRVYPFKKEMQTVCGRGGTDMNKVLDYYEDNRQFDACILLTDGYTPMREYPPRRPWLWCFTNTHDKPVEWGQCVILPPPENEAA